MGDASRVLGAPRWPLSCSVLLIALKLEEERGKHKWPVEPKLQNRFNFFG